MLLKNTLKMLRKIFNINKSIQRGELKKKLRKNCQENLRKFHADMDFYVNATLSHHSPFNYTKMTQGIPDFKDTSSFRILRRNSLRILFANKTFESL